MALDDHEQNEGAAMVGLQNMALQPNEAAAAAAAAAADANDEPEDFVEEYDPEHPGMNDEAAMNDFQQYLN